MFQNVMCQAHCIGAINWTVGNAEKENEKKGRNAFTSVGAFMEQVMRCTCFSIRHLQQHRFALRIPQPIAVTSLYQILLQALLFSLVLQSAPKLLTTSHSSRCGAPFLPPKVVVRELGGAHQSAQRRQH